MFSSSESQKLIWTQAAQIHEEWKLAGQATPNILSALLIHGLVKQMGTLPVVPV